MRDRHAIRRTSRAVFGVLLLSAAVSIAVAGPVVRDDAGREIRLDRPARRIVSLAPHVTELLYEVGAGDRLIAATPYSDYPEAATRLPRIGGLSGIDIEAIVALRPDLVVAWQSGTSPAQLDTLARLGIPVYRSEPRQLDDVALTLERFGVLTGRESEAAVQATAFRRQVETLRTTYAARAPVRVFYQVWNNPLMTVGGPHLITGVLSLCGGRNVFASVPMLGPTIDIEAVIAADPELIVTASTDPLHKADLALWQRWTGVSAVRNKRYLFLEPSLITRHTSRILQGADTLCRAIDEVRRAR